jgi:hypothetical protein
LRAIYHRYSSRSLKQSFDARGRPEGGIARSLPTFA